MNKQELENKLNEMLVGKSAYDMFKLSDYLKKHISDLGINNEQGEWKCNLCAYIISLVYKTFGVVSFDIKRAKHSEFRWVVKQVVINDETFVDLDTKLAYIHNHYKKEIERFDEWNLYATKMGDLKDLLKLVKQTYKDKTKLDLLHLLHDLQYHYWLVDEALESEK